MRKAVIMVLVLCLLLGGCSWDALSVQETEPSKWHLTETLPAITIPEQLEHPLKQAYQEQPNAYVAFNQTHQQPLEVYVPIEEVMAYQTQYPDCNGTWYRDQLQGEDLLIYQCYLYAMEHCYLSFLVYVEDNDRDFDFIREAFSMDTPLLEQNINQRGESISDWPTNYWGERLHIRLEQFTVSRWEKRMEALEQCRRIVAEIPVEYSTQLQKMEYLYRYVCDHVEYVEYENMLDEDYFYDAVIKGQTVCDGYSNMLMLLFRLIGVECCELSGYDVDLSSDEVYEDAGGHTWVAAKVEEEWYHFDATFGDNERNEWAWDGLYFGFSDRRLAKAFLECEDMRPKCTDLSRDFPNADLTVSDITEGSDVKKIARMVEKRLKEGCLETTIGVHSQVTEADHSTMIKKYQKYATDAYRLEFSYIEIGSSTLMFITATKE